MSFVTKLTFCLISCAFISLTAIGQERKDLSFSFAMGPSNSFEYYNTKPGNFKSFDMDYYFRKRHIFSANYYDGSDHLTSSTIYILPRLAYYTSVSVLYKYLFIDRNKFSLLAGTGWGKMVHGIDTKLMWNDFVIPIRFESIYKLSKHINGSLIGGFFIMPDIPIVSYHIGPRISYVFK
jgi:hypothetical protein